MMMLRRGRPCLLLALILALVLLPLPTTAQSQDVKKPKFCDAEVLATCPRETLIPFEEFSSSFPVIRYCLRPDNGGFLPVTHETCETVVGGTWTVRPDWAARNATYTLEEQYTCTVCTALNASALSRDESAVWIISLNKGSSYSLKAFAGMSQRLGDIRLDQLIVSEAGHPYLYAYTSFSQVQNLVNASRYVLAAQPLPAELKISPRVTDPASLFAVVSSPSSSPLSMEGEGMDKTTATLSIRTLISSHLDTTRRAAHHDHGLRAIHKALGMSLPEHMRVPPPPQNASPEHVGVVVTHNDDHEGGSSSSSSSSSSNSGCEGCTVKATGDGNYVVSSIPITATAEAAANISHALASALVIDLGVRFELFNKEAAFLLQSGANSTGLGPGGKKGSTWLWDHGLTGEGEVIGVVDTGLDVSSCFFHDSMHPLNFQLESVPELEWPVPVFQSDDHRKIREYFAYADGREGVDGGHGTHICGSVAGYPAEMAVSSKGYAFKGAAWAAKIAFFDIGLAHDDTLYVPSDLANGLFPRTYNLGGRVHCNSWGSSISDNSAEMHQTDAYLWRHQDFVILYAAGNEGPVTGTIGSPALSKNSIAVGATLNNVNTPDVAYFSSRGPTFDMRYGIDVCAPGYYIASAYSQADGGANQCYIQGMAGTSMSTPLVAGTTALLRQYFTRGFYPLGWASPEHAFIPMGALLKAVLINSALQMTGPEATKHNTRYIKYPNYDQGYGMVAAKFATYFQGSDNPNVLFIDGAWQEDENEEVCRGCPKLNQRETAWYRVVPTSRATIKVTLAWYDFPAAVTISSKTLINDLDLTATQGTTQYFANGWTSTSGPNSLNNVEQIIIPSPVIGQIINIKVVGAAVVAGPQPYALVITGQFRKDSTLFPTAVPRVTSIATDGAQALLVGSNLPRSANHPQTFLWTCVSDPSIGLTAEVTDYSAETAAFLVGVLNTTACESFRVQVVSDGFVGNVSEPFTYGAAKIQRFCVDVASDDTCWSLIACAGQCLKTQRVDGGGGAPRLDRLTIIIWAVGILMLLLCCCCGFCMRKRCCINDGNKEEEGYQARAAPSRRTTPLRHEKPAPTAVMALRSPPSSPGPSRQRQRQQQQQQDGYVSYVSPPSSSASPRGRRGEGGGGGGGGAGGGGERGGEQATAHFTTGRSSARISPSSLPLPSAPPYEGKAGRYV